MDTKKLRQKILDLAIRGKLVPQDPNDEPASVLLERIRAEKERLIKEGKIKRSKKTAADEEIEAPFEIPESWEWTTIEDLLINRDSERVPLSLAIRKKQTNKKYDYYGAAGVIDKVDGYIFSERLLLIGEDGANLLSKSKDNAFFAEGKYWVNNHAHVLDCCEKFILDYVAFVINSMSLENYVTGSAQPKLTQDNLKKILIPLPPQKEQQRIIESANKWFSIIDALESNEDDLLKAIDQTKSKILDLAIHGKLVPQDPNDEPAIELLKRINPKFESNDNMNNQGLPNGWLMCSVKDVFQINPKTSTIDNLDAAFVPMTNIEDQYNNNFVFETRKWGDIKRGYTHFQDGDIAVAKISPCLENRKSVVFCNLPNGIGAGTTELNVFRSEIVNPSFGLYFFKSNHFISNCVGTFNGVVGQQRVATKIVEEISFFLPPYKEQLRIVTKIEELFAVLDSIKL